MAVRALKVVPVDDATLVERVRCGDEAAFTQLYQRHARYLAGVVYRVMGHGNELEDVLQDTFADALRDIAQLRDPAHIRPWLVTIAVRRTHRALRARRRRLWFGLRVAEVSPQCSDPEVGRRAHELYDALDRLPADVRIPWVLHRIEDETLPSVAAACEVSLATVKRRIARGDELLDRRLDAAR